MSLGIVLIILGIAVAMLAHSGLGALLILVGYLKGGDPIPTEVSGAIVILVAWIAPVVTLYISRRQKQGLLSSGTGGEVKKD